MFLLGWHGLHLGICYWSDFTKTPQPCPSIWTQREMASWQGKVGTSNAQYFIEGSPFLVIESSMKR